MDRWDDREKAWDDEEKALELNNAGVDFLSKKNLGRLLHVLMHQYY